jgi:hypothetical protein
MRARAQTGGCGRHFPVSGRSGCTSKKNLPKNEKVFKTKTSCAQGDLTLQHQQLKVLLTEAKPCEKLKNNLCFLI